MSASQRREKLGRTADEHSLQLRRVAYGTASRFAGRAAGGLVSLLALHYATRYFGPLRWGPITAAVAWTAIFVALGNPGIATYVLRETARTEENRRNIYAAGLAAAMAFGLLASVLAIFLGAAIYWRHPETIVLVALLAPSILLLGVFNTSGMALAARRRNDVRAILDVLSSVFLLLATLAVVGWRLHADGYAALYTLSTLASALVALALGTAVLRPIVRDVRSRVLPLVRRAAPFSQLDLLMTVYARVDSVLLFLIAGARPVALYGVATQIASFPMSMPIFLTTALLPEYVAADHARRAVLAQHAFDVVASVMLPVPFFAVLFADKLVVWLAGPRFAGAGTLLVVLSVAVVLVFINVLLFQLVVFSGAEARLWRLVGIVLATNVVGNLIAIPLFGATGAAAMMVVSEAAAFVLYWRRFRVVTKMAPDPRHLIVVAAAVGALIGIWFVLHDDLGLAIGRGVGIVGPALALVGVYLVLLVASTWLWSRFANRAG